MIYREDIELREEKELASYATKSKDSRGRKYPEEEHPYRSIYQRDKDRIIHSTAFRRLEYKTQVFVNHEGDYYRTRLTHTIEVAQISRCLARTLNLNEDLAEAIALAHDLGHTPFGHSGEEALCKLMKGHGGFEHNLQALRVVDVLERRYPNFPGLNLSWEVRHCRQLVVDFSPEISERKRSLEKFLGENVYMHYRVARMADKARRFVEELFKAFVPNPRQLPPDFQTWVEKEGIHRGVCDYIAGMTDHYAQDEYLRLF